MAHRDRRPHYHVYLLRLWREADARHDGSRLWRFSLESPHTRERFGFTSIATLADFLDHAVSALDSANGTAEAPDPDQEESRGEPE